MNYTNILRFISLESILNYVIFFILVFLVNQFDLGFGYEKYFYLMFFCIFLIDIIRNIEFKKYYIKKFDIYTLISVYEQQGISQFKLFVLLNKYFLLPLFVFIYVLYLFVKQTGFYNIDNWFIYSLIDQSVLLVLIAFSMGISMLRNESVSQFSQRILVNNVSSVGLSILIGFVILYNGLEIFAKYNVFGSILALVGGVFVVFVGIYLFKAE